MNQNNIKDWLKHEIKNNFGHIENIQCWIFGSCLVKKNPRDCDVLIIYPATHMEYVILSSKLMKDRFKNIFYIPLHLIKLTEEEAEQFNHFIKLEIGQRQLLR